MIPFCFIEFLIYILTPFSFHSSYVMKPCVMVILICGGKLLL